VGFFAQWWTYPDFFIVPYQCGYIMNNQFNQVNVTVISDLDKEPSSPWLIVICIAIPVFLGSLDLTVISAFLPALLSELGLTLNAEGLANVSWILTSYLLAYSISLFAGGRISDIVGRRAALTIYLSIYVLGSLLVVFFDIPANILEHLYDAVGINISANTTNVYAIIFGRMVAAFGAGAITSIAIALVSDIFPSDKSAVPMGFVMAVDTIGWLIGAAWGGIVIQYLPWRAIFLINIPFILLALALIINLLRNVEQPKETISFDFLGFLLLITVLAGFNIGFANFTAGGQGVNLPAAAPGLVVGMISLLVFIRSQINTPNPLIVLTIFRAPSASAITLTNLLVGFCMFIPMMGIPILMNMRKLNEIGFGVAISSIRDIALKNASFETGILVAAYTVPIAGASIIGGWVLDRISAMRIVVLGLFIAAWGYGLLWFVLTIDTSNFQIGLFLIITGIGIGLTFAPVIATTLQSVSPSKSGMASALVLGVRMIGITIATSTLSAFSTQRINDLVETVEQGRFVLDVVSPDDYPTVFATTYIYASVQSLNEMAFFGLIFCGVGIFVIWFSTLKQLEQR
jgi:MFS family permease